ncbi:MAG TPA: MFS transporter [Micromonosporaceae bacterium]
MADGGLWRDRNFMLLWSGQTVSEIGSQVTVIALPLVAVVTLRAGAFEVGVLTAASWAAWLVIGLPAGVWVDRVRRRPLLILADLGRALALATVPAAWAAHLLTIPHLVVVALVTGLLTVLFDVAYPVYLPAIASRERLVDANGKMQASASVAMVGGPGLGGLLVQLLGAPVALLTDVASFVVSALTLIRIRSVEQVTAAPEESGFARELRQGVRYVLTHPLPRTLALGGAIANFALGGYNAVLVVFLVREVGLPGGLVGLMFGIASVGGLIGALLAGRIADRYGNAVIIIATPLLGAVAGLLIPLTGAGSRLIWYFVGAALLSAGVAVHNVCARSAVQICTPPELLGRAGASIRLFSRGALPVGALTAGAVASVATARLTIVMLMVLLSVAAVVVRLSPLGQVRRVEELAPATA